MKTVSLKIRADESVVAAILNMISEEIIRGDVELIEMKVEAGEKER